MLLHTSISHQNADNNKQTELVLTQKNEFMKKVKIIMIVVLTSAFSLSTRAQGVSTGLDLVSTYVWRGTKYRSRLPEDPGNRLRIRISVTPVVAGQTADSQPN